MRQRDFMLSLSVVSNSLQPPWTVAQQTPLSMEFSRQEYWNGLPFPPPGDLPNPGIELASLASCFTDRQILHHCATWEALPLYQYTKIFLLYSAWTSQIYTATIILGHTCTYFSKIEIIDSWDKYIFDLSTQGQNK